LLGSVTEVKLFCKRADDRSRLVTCEHPEFFNALAV
jgi:hypothetical protein